MISLSQLIHFALCNAVLFNTAVGHLCNSEYDDFYASQIILFVSPKGMRSMIKKQISIYYYNPGFLPGDTLDVYSRDSSKLEPVLLDSFKPTDKKGVWETKIAPRIPYNAYSDFKSQCLGYHATWSRNNTIRKMNCLSTHPDWMSVRRDILMNQKLKDIFIPGTHNSGAYSEDKRQSIIQHFTVTQDTDIHRQLRSGARYFDLRPAFDKKYWVYHGPIRMNRMEDIVRDVKRFMDNTEEIVILSFKEFPKGFNSEQRHLDFMNYLEVEFADYLLPHNYTFGWSITLGNIWKTGKRLILSYDHYTYSHRRTMWPAIKQYWGDVREINDLQTYLQKVETNYPPPKVSMAELTLDLRTVISFLPAHIVGVDLKSLRRLGALVGPRVTAWYNELFYSLVNIVAVDYIDATGIVDVAIDWNERRFSSCFNYYSQLMEIDAKNNR